MDLKAHFQKLVEEYPIVFSAPIGENGSITLNEESIDAINAFALRYRELYAFTGTLLRHHNF